jgi:hypothetical protein
LLWHFLSFLFSVLFVLCSSFNSWIQAHPCFCSGRLGCKKIPETTKLEIDMQNLCAYLFFVSKINNKLFKGRKIKLNIFLYILFLALYISFIDIHRLGLKVDNWTTLVLTITLCYLIFPVAWEYASEEKWVG